VSVVWGKLAGVDEGELDPQLIRRIVRRVGAYLEADGISEESLDQVFEMFNADDAHRSAVARALARTGVTVIRRALAEPTVDNGPAMRTERAADGRDAGPIASTRFVPSADRNPRPRRRSELEDARDLLVEDRKNRTPWKRLLTAREEVGLARMMRGNQIPLSEALPRGFRATCADTDDRARAFDAFVLHNRGLVWSLTKAYIGRGLEPDDLEQSGYEGLRRAVEKYDGSVGWKFSTYATHWINQALQRAVANDGRLIRLPVHVHEKVNKILAVRARLLGECRRIRVSDIADQAGVNIEQVLEALRLAAGVVSLDTPVSEDGSSSLADFVDDERWAAADPGEAFIEVALREEIREVVESLPEREAVIVKLRFGLDGDEELTLDAIGMHLGVTRERVRQIESKVKAKLGVLLRERGFGPPMALRTSDDATV
jgi:RNA polymerase primary sigma factor